MDDEKNIKDLQALSWYHSNVDRHIAESLLMQNGREGYYLLRPNIYGNVFTLSVRVKESVKHFQISVYSDEISFGFGKFKNVDDLTKHFNNHPLIAGESGIPVMLRCPYPNSVTELSHYEQVRVHAEMRIQECQLEDDECGNYLLSMASKEGFLTKQGGRIKSWKHRWCVLQKLELKYFSKRSDNEPLRTIDLRESISCCADKTQKLEHCFSLSLPWRTFYFCATSESEMQEWIQMINWKLESLKSGHKT